MPAPSLCVVSGTVYDENGAAAPNVTLYLKRALLNGVLIGTAPIGSVSFPSLSGGDQTVFYIEAITSNASGVVTFTVPQLSTIYLEGNVSGYNNGEVALSIPATATSTLEALTPATFPIDVTTFTFLSLVDTPDAFTGQALKNVRVNAAGTALEFAAPVVVDNETVQDALSAFFPDSAPFDWTYDDAGDRVTLAILDATASARGLMSTAYAARLDQLEVGDSPTFTGLTLSGLTQGSIPFAGAGGVISQDNAALFWDATNDRLGVNKSVPTSQFHVLSNAIGVVPLRAEGPAGQTGNLFEAMVNGVVMASITTGGTYTTTNSIVGRNNTMAFQSSDSFSLGSAIPILWSNSTVYTGTKDLSLTRQGVGVLQVGDGGVNANGKVRAAEYQVAAIKVIGAQGAAVADATDAASAITQLNLLLARLRAATGHGLIA